MLNLPENILKASAISELWQITGYRLPMFISWIENIKNRWRTTHWVYASRIIQRMLKAKRALWGI
jgi:hypothetical protein